MMRRASELLRMLAERVPPPSTMRHGIVLHEDGRLMVAIAAEGQHHVFFLDEEDLDKEPQALLEDIMVIWERLTTSTASSNPVAPLVDRFVLRRVRPSDSSGRN